jgi:hypothetical protein
MTPDRDVLMRRIGPSEWRIRVPGVYFTVATSWIERDLALSVASLKARRARCRRYAEGYPRTAGEWR